MKKSLLMLIFLLILASSVKAAVISVGGNDLSSPEGSTLRIEILSTDPFPAKPGQQLEMDVRVTNVGNSKAADVILEIQEEFPFQPVEKQVGFGELPPGVSATKKLTVSIARESITGEVKVPIRASPDNGRTWFEPKPTIIIRESDSILAITSAKTEPEYIAPGHDGTLIIKLRNDGSTTLSSVEITLDEDEAPIVPSRGSNIRYVDSIRPGETSVIEFPISAKSDADSGSYAPKLIISYSDFSQTTTKTYNIGIKIFEEPSYVLNIESREAYTGNDLGKVVMSLANTGTSDLKFTTLKILEGEGYEVIDGESSYLGDLEPDDFQTAEFLIKFDTKEDHVKINTLVSYKDGFNKQKSDKEVIELRIFDEANAILLGLKEKPNVGGIIFNIMIGSTLIIFWILMIVDWKKNKNLTSDKRIAWIAILILANLLGAILYYFIGRKSKK